MTISPTVKAHKLSNKTLRAIMNFQVNPTSKNSRKAQLAMMKYLDFTYRQTPTCLIVWGYIANAATNAFEHPFITDFVEEYTKENREYINLLSVYEAAQSKRDDEEIPETSMAHPRWYEPHTG